MILVWQYMTLRSMSPKQEDTNKVAEKSKTERILVTVYYEALCPDSRNFVIKQLLPTFNSIERYIRVQLVPYGKAGTIFDKNDDYIFTCQHGETECKANIVHACTIDKIQDSRKQLDLVACMIRNNMEPMDILQSCAGEMSEYNDIVNCSESIEGRRLLMKYGEMTNNLSPKVSFIPTIALDNDLSSQVLILKNLLRQVCLRLESPPEECKS